MFVLELVFVWVFVFSSSRSLCHERLWCVWWASQRLLGFRSGREKKQRKKKYRKKECLHDIIHPGLLRRAPSEAMRSWPSFSLSRSLYLTHAHTHTLDSKPLIKETHGLYRKAEKILYLLLVTKKNQKNKCITFIFVTFVTNTASCMPNTCASAQLSKWFLTLYDSLLSGHV